MKVSRITKFLMDHGARLIVTLRTTYYRRSLFMQGGLEIPCPVDGYMMSSTVLAVENFYMVLPDDGCVGSFVETPVASIDFNIPSTSKGKGKRNDSKGKKSAKTKGKKRCCHEEHQKLLWRLNYCKIEIEWPT